MEYYSKAAKEELERRKIKAEATAEMWENVKRVYKKNGEPFANLAQNFKNATITARAYSKDEKEIKVNACIRGKYYSDSLSLAVTIQTDEEAEKMEKAGRLQERGAWIKPFYTMNPDEAEKAIKSRAQYEREYAEELGEVLENFEEMAAELVELRHKAAEICEKAKTASFVLQTIFKESRL